MKNQTKFSLSLLLIVAATTGIFTSATAQKVRSVEGEISVPQTVNELHFNSTSSLDFVIETHNKSDILYNISVTREKWAKTDSLTKNQLFSVNESDSKQTVTFTRPFTEYNQNSKNNKQMSWIKALLKGDSGNDKVYTSFAETTIILTIPEDLSVSFALNHGDIELHGLNADFNLDGSSTDLILSSITGKLTIKNSYGDIELDDIVGDVQIDTRSSDIEIENLRGDLTINTGYSDIELSEISGNVYIDNRSGDILLSDVIGDIELTADYSDVEISNAEGDITTNLRSGELIIQHLTGDVTHIGDYTDVELTTISGPGLISLESRSAEIKVFEIKNEIYISGSNLDITGDDLNGGFSSDSKSSEIDLSEISGEIYISGNNDIRLKKFSSEKIIIDNSQDDAELLFDSILPNELTITTHNGDVTLDFSALSNLSAAFDFNVINGEIITNNDRVKQSEITEENDSEMFKTILGDGDSEITVSVSNGKLRIR